MKNTVYSKPKTFWILLLFAFGFILSINVGCEFAPPEGTRSHQADLGEAIFKTQCSPCHGMGDMLATVDTLKVQAPDLTLINQRRGVRAFPIAEVARIIDGRNLVKAHGARDMPVWGEVYAQEGLDEAEIKGKKGELVAYLMRIQKVPQGGYK